VPRCNDCEVAWTDTSEWRCWCCGGPSVTGALFPGMQHQEALTADLIARNRQWVATADTASLPRPTYGTTVDPEAPW
jgi:hypothetical protein